MIRPLILVSIVALAATGVQAQSGSLYKQARQEAIQAAATDKASPGGPSTVEPLRVQSLTAPPKANPRMFAKEQLITIIVRESASHTTNGSASTSREASIDAKVDAFVRFHGGTHGMIRPVNFPNGKPAIKADGERTFDGSGTTGRTDNLVARITGKIIDIKPNGNLVIEASKKITADEETYTITLTGTCRTEDVTPDNSILSTQVAELDITKKSTGMVKDATKRGLLHKISDFLNIF